MKFHSTKLEQWEQTKLKARGRKEIVNIKVEISERENKKQKKNQLNQKIYKINI